jgi:hypothetical protein
METSFYYFFSAVPQVLGGVLALFGVFVVFKIQTLKSQLLGIGNAVILKIQDKINVLEIINNEDKRATLSNIQTYIEKSDIEGLSEIMKLLTNAQVTIFRDNYQATYSFLKDLINNTVKASIYTALVVVLTLALIPFGTFFLNHIILLYVLFAAVILAIGGCFYLFVSILKIALNTGK